MRTNMGPFTLLLARQRSGTGALGSVLHHHPELYYLGEIFHPDNVGQERNFFTTLKQLCEQDNSFSLPDRRTDILKLFLESICEDGRTEFPILDIKYRSLHHLNGGWQGFFERPRMIQIARENGFPIIHLKRANFVETFVSGILAERNKIWHARATDTIQHTTIRVKKGPLERYLKNTAREVMLMDSWLHEHDQLVEIEYSEMFDLNGAIRQQVCDEISYALGVKPFVNRKPALIKQAPRQLPESITNFSELKKAFSETEFAWMFEDDRLDASA